jgi:hypothetical protein
MHHHSTPTPCPPTWVDACDLVQLEAPHVHRHQPPQAAHSATRQGESRHARQGARVRRSQGLGRGEADGGDDTLGQCAVTRTQQTPVDQVTKPVAVSELKLCDKTRVRKHHVGCNHSTSVWCDCRSSPATPHLQLPQGRLYAVASHRE